MNSQPLSDSTQKAADSVLGEAPQRVPPAGHDRLEELCVHCGEPTDLPPDPGTNLIFCCGGCRGAYQLIHGWGLADFYALREHSKQTGTARAAGQAARYEQFDSEDYLGHSTPATHADGSCSTELAVHGLHCGACAWLIENAAKHQSGLLSAQVRMSRHTIEVVFDPTQTKLSQIAAFLDRLGYQVAPFDPSKDRHIYREHRRQLIQIAIAGFLAANAMWIAVALYAGEFSGVATDHRYFLAVFGATLGLASVAGPGRTFFKGALAALRTRTPHMDLPVALGLLVGTIVGSWNALSGRGDTYFDSLTMLVFLLLVGRWIQFGQQQRAARAVDLMMRLTPQHAELIVEGQQTRTVLVDNLLAGDLVLVDAGNVIPADGEVTLGESRVNRSLLTGESDLIKVATGDEVAAGVVNVTSPLQVRVSATGRESRIGRVMQSVEAAAADKSPIVLLADRIGGYFVLSVMALAMICFAIWVGDGVGPATSHATALLIVACPCALALATPLAVAVALGRAARSGILIRDGSALQVLNHPGRIWFDKTGTLTEGKQRVTTYEGTRDTLDLVLAVEQQCRHPIASAIERYCQDQGISVEDLPDCHDFRNVAGGVTGVVNGLNVCVGNEELMLAENIAIDAAHRATIDRLLGGGESPILVGVGGVFSGVFGIADPIRAGAADLIRVLKQKGWRVGILSGDHARIAKRVGTHLGIDAEDCLGGQSPEDKLAYMNQSRSIDDARPEKVIMIGDGANDAAALAAADVGIALRGGAEVSLQAAPVYIASADLKSIGQLIEGSVRTGGVIRRAFLLSLSYNVIAVGLALLGWITPLVAAVLMPISSVSVLAMTLASRSFESAQAESLHQSSQSSERLPE